MEFDSFVLAAATADVDEEPIAREHADAVEFRMDLADEPVRSLREYEGALPIVATNRATWEGGGRPCAPDGRREGVTETERLETLGTVATEVDAVEAIDVELGSILEGDAEDVLEGAFEQGVSVVASAHDFEETPPRAEMVRTLTEAGKHADVAKLAVTAETRRDTLAVLSATEQLTAHGDAVATMAMGEMGGHTRAVAPVYGSRIGYAPVDPAAATAPGQYDLETLARLVAELR